MAARSETKDNFYNSLGIRIFNLGADIFSGLLRIRMRYVVSKI